MYTYYFTNAYGFKSNWTMILKKSITKIQMVIPSQSYLLMNECISRNLYDIYLFSSPDPVCGCIGTMLHHILSGLQGSQSFRRALSPSTFFDVIHVLLFL